MNNRTPVQRYITVTAWAIVLTAGMDEIKREMFRLEQIRWIWEVEMRGKMRHLALVLYIDPILDISDPNGYTQKTIVYVGLVLQKEAELETHL